MVSWFDILTIHCRFSLGPYLALTSVLGSTSKWTLNPFCSFVSSPAYASISICSWWDLLVGPWIWCTTCLVLNYWWMDTSTSTHFCPPCSDSMVLCLLVRSFPQLGSLLPSRLFLPWGVAIGHCSLMLAVQRSLFLWSYPLFPSSSLERSPSQFWVMPPEGRLP